MKYKLAQKLKDAGFPQEYHDCVGDWEGNCVCHNDRWEKDVMKPTLEELIEACGDGFRSLTYHSDKTKVNGKLKINNRRWMAKAGGRSVVSEFPHRLFNARTPSEAVAKLYLALNNK